MPLTIDYSDHVITATVERPESKNAVNFELMDRLETLVSELEQNVGVRLLILQGSAGSFISGGDLREFHQLKTAGEAKEMTNRMLSLLERIRNLPFWTLALMNGDTYGGGWEIASVFDFRVAKQQIKIGFTQGKFYLPPGWGGVTSLSKLVPKQKALYWLATQRIVSADEAFKAGFLDDIIHTDSLETEIDSLIKKLTLNDRPFIEYLKRSIRFSSPDEEIEPFSQFWESKQHNDRVQAFLDRKKR